ncbi:HAD family hydrolase [uncultured Streptomyces sp.]|uniref:HAD family hydrolase n=1 Tax=uncultured Streptomyces sp. TaxID=174707 RepID=UPI002611C196|nr:HAD family hydrolase [uncultured Streptomyces sp.]
MRLLMIDLDNTLVDRDAAFRDAVTEFVTAHALPAGEVAWLTGVDASGHAPREDVALAMTRRYGDGVPPDAVRRLLDTGAADRVVLEDPVRQALGRAEAARWAVVVVTNGRVAQQEKKIRRTGLAALVRGWVVSEGIGLRKPDPRIFQAAAETAGVPLKGAWMIGDSARADIAGAAAVGAVGVWVSGGRPWTETGYRPDHVTRDVVEAVDLALDTAG